MRGYVFEIETGEETAEELLLVRAKQEIVKNLASQWNQVNREIECYGWDEHSREMEDDFFADQFEEQFLEEIDLLEQKLGRKPNREEREELRDKVSARINERQDAHINVLYAKREALEQVLRQLGARMMRPYEHWNEDERRMQYLEEDRWANQDY